jgi:glycosyltransferase involved in cell wall biosynthesis
MNSGSEPLVSIVTPVYNNSAHLTECIESVIAQTFDDWEYTILDNCSTDGSVEIARRYAARDPRIQVLTADRFLPVIANHNRALRRISAKGKYCKMVFADDWIFPECLAQMVGLAEAKPSVGIVGAYILDGAEIGVTGLPFPSTLVDGREICRKMLRGEFYGFGSANAVLYRADLVRARNPFYNEKNIHADQEALFAILNTSDLGFVHQVLSFTRKRPEGLSTVSTEIGTYYGCMLHILVTYGRDYLDRGEYEDCLDRLLSQYYGFLAKGLMFRRGSEFWAYHKSAFVEAGISFSRGRLARETLATLYNAVLNPKDTIERLLARSRNRTGFLSAC